MALEFIEKIESTDTASKLIYSLSFLSRGISGANYNTEYYGFYNEL